MNDQTEILSGDLVITSCGLQDRWQQSSLQAGWKLPGDWLVPEVAETTRARVRGDELQNVAKRLGASRAYHGVGVRETMMDLRAFYAVAGLPPDDSSMLALVEGWTAEIERLEPLSCTDVRTGLATFAHFERLIYDVAVSGSKAQQAQTIASLHLDWSDHGHRLGWDLLADVGNICSEELATINVSAAYHRGSIHAIMERTTQSYEALFRCRERLDALTMWPSPATTVDFEPVPTTQADFTKTTAALRTRRAA